MATFVLATREVLSTGTRPRARTSYSEKPAPGVELRFLRRHGPSCRSSTSGLTQKNEAETSSADASDRLTAAYRQAWSPELPPAIRPPHWGNLSAKTRWRFRVGGLGSGASAAVHRRWLSASTREKSHGLFETWESPPLERTSRGNTSATGYSVRNAPARARAPSNVVLENGCRKPCAWQQEHELSRSFGRKEGTTRISAIKVAGKSVVSGSAKAGAFAAATEAASFNSGELPALQAWSQDRWTSREGYHEECCKRRGNWRRNCRSSKASCHRWRRTVSRPFGHACDDRRRVGVRRNCY